jgi:hypothetical protein
LKLIIASELTILTGCFFICISTATALAHVDQASFAYTSCACKHPYTNQTEKQKTIVKVYQQMMLVADRDELLALQRL